MKRILAVVLALFLCMGSALADVVIPELPGGTDKYSCSESWKYSKGYIQYRVFNKKHTCTDEEFDGFIRQLEKLGFRNKGTEHRMEFVYSGKDAASLGTFEGDYTDAMHVLVWEAGMGLTIRVADGIVIETADAVSEPTVDAQSSAAQSSSREPCVFTAWVKIGDEWHNSQQFETDEEYVLDVLLEEDFVKGEKVSWGFNVTTVDGIRADYDRKGEYWSILKYSQEAGDFVPMEGTLEREKVEAWASYCFELEGVDTADSHAQESLKRFAVVVEIDGAGDYYTFETDQEYVLDVLLEDGFIRGEDVSWGFNVTTVAGRKADYKRKGEYWSILKFNKTTGQFEPMMESLAGQKVQDGVGYTFVLEK